MRKRNATWHQGQAQVEKVYDHETARIYFPAFSPRLFQSLSRSLTSQIAIIVYFAAKEPIFNQTISLRSILENRNRLICTSNLDHGPCTKRTILPNSKSRQIFDKLPWLISRILRLKIELYLIRIRKAASTFLILSLNSQNLCLLSPLV